MGLVNDNAMDVEGVDTSGLWIRMPRERPLGVKPKGRRPKDSGKTSESYRNAKSLPQPFNAHVDLILPSMRAASGART